MRDIKLIVDDLINRLAVGSELSENILLKAIHQARAEGAIETLEWALKELAKKYDPEAQPCYKDCTSYGHSADCFWGNLESATLRWLHVEIERRKGGGE